MSLVGRGAVALATAALLACGSCARRDPFATEAERIRVAAIPPRSSWSGGAIARSPYEARTDWSIAAEQSFGDYVAWLRPRLDPGFEEGFDSPERTIWGRSLPGERQTVAVEMRRDGGPAQIRVSFVVVAE